MIKINYHQAKLGKEFLKNVTNPMKLLSIFVKNGCMNLNKMFTP